MFNLRHKIFEWITSQKWYYEFNEDLIYSRGYNFVYIYITIVLMLFLAIMDSTI